MIEFFMKLVNF